MEPDYGERPTNPPIFTAPSVLVGLIALLVGIHVARGFLSVEADQNLLLEFALFPARYGATEEGILYRFPGGMAADAWSLVTYAFLHADWAHLFMNGVWLLAFGTPVARRLGTWRFVAFYLICAVAAGVVFAAIHAGSIIPVIGASGAISGVIGGAILFVFEESGPVGALARGVQARDVREIPRRPTLVALMQPRALIFVGVWLGINLVFGAFGLGAVADGQMVAWEAHVAGFVAGLLLFPVFDKGAVAQR